MKIVTFSEFLILSLLASCFVSLAGAITTHPDEVKALKEIAKTLGKKNWDFSIDPCSGNFSWSTPSVNGSLIRNNVSCININDDNFYHVVSIVLKSQNLSGTLPNELVRLPYLQEIDLTRNYLNGTIPPQWGSMQLVNISISGNRLTGPIPGELGNITTLESLVLDFNQFYGVLPLELGNLPRLKILHLSSNYFTGNLPATFARLTTLISIRLSDNQFSGTLPNFIQSWSSLERLVMHGSGFSGPVNSVISLLHNLTDLRLSDLKGPNSQFPQLQNLTKLETLILRSCNLIGNVPGFLGAATSLKNLYLTGNLLSGSLPKWINVPDNIDLSYNNLNIPNPEELTCQQGNTNLFDSSLRGNMETIPCLGNRKCSKIWYSLRINCGGKLISNGNMTYDDDSYEAGQANFYRSGSNWVYSNTGHFYDTQKPTYYVWSNTTKLDMNNSELYMDARVSALSLTYYGYCMGNGNYTVNLHFAEIMFTNDQTYSSLGRRVFDIYIQRKLVLEDFNIAKEAGGFGKEIIKNFTTIVSSSTLEIRLQWAGKGTTGIPFASVYGPLISAITVHSDFSPPVENGSHIPVQSIVAIVVAGTLVIIILFGIAWWRGCFGQKNSLEIELMNLNLQMGLFTMRQIKAATKNFDISNKIGEGGFGPVYKGVLSNGIVIAVKMLSSKSKQGNREFINEIGMISALQHPCLVKLYGCCVEGDHLLLVYEYMENNSLAHALFGNGESCLRLDWPTRQKICVGIARGLAFLHEESRLKVVHRDIKATNVLLDKDLNPKISDFGLAKLDEENDTHISTRIAGTYGYMAPEYAMHGYLTHKADVYSFGVVALEIVSGKSNTIHRPKQQALHLLDLAHLLKEKGNLMELVDRRLGSNFNKEEVMTMIKVALLCTNTTSNLRPTMSSVLSMLERNSEIPEFISDPAEIMDEMKLELMRHYYFQVEENERSEIETQSDSLLTEETWNASSSAADLYPVQI